MRYLTGMVQDNSHLSPHTQELIDIEVKNLVTEQFERAQAVLRENREALETLSQELLAKETVDGTAVHAALEAAKPAAAPEQEAAPELETPAEPEAALERGDA